MEEPARRRARRRGGERGVSAIIFALLLSVLMMTSAFAVDIGQAYAERRHDQNTVDAAVMSGLVKGLLDGGSIEGVVREVRDKVDTTLGRTVSDEEWLSCTDGGQLHFNTQELQVANEVISPATQCISFNETFEELRVKLPDQEVEGIFSPAVGFENLHVSAAANGSISSGTGGLPFVALSTATHGDFVCLRTSSAKQPLPLAEGNGPGAPATFPADGAPGSRPDPCDKDEFDVDSQRFGTLKPFRYKDGCTQQNTDWEIAVAIGLDHPMGVFPEGYLEYPPPPPADGSPDPYEIRYDGAPFTGTTAERCATAYPNTFELDEGLNAGGLSCSLILNAGDLCNGITPRLQAGPRATTNPHALLGETYFDNSGPWDFLRDSDELAAEGSPQSCVDLAASRSLTVDPSSALYWDHYDKFDALIDCLHRWNRETAPGSGVFYPDNVLFTDEVGESARFGFVPQVYEDALDVDYVHIEGFLPVFMYRLYIQQSGSMCDPADTRSTQLMVHDAGQMHACGGTNKTIDRLASIIFACGMVSKDLCAKPTELNASSGRDIYDFRLTR